MAKRKSIDFSTVAIAAIVAGLIGFVAGRATSPRQAASPVEVAAVAPEGGAVYDEKKIAFDPSPSKGPHDAPVVIYEVSEFQ